MALDPARKRALRKYAAKLDEGAQDCRIERRHNFPGLSQYGKSGKVTVEYNRREAVYEVLVICERCGLPVHCSIGKDGTLTGKRRPDYDAVLNYKWAYDSYAMTPEDRAYLRQLLIASLVKTFGVPAVVQ